MSYKSLNRGHFKMKTFEDVKQRQQINLNNNNQQEQKQSINDQTIDMITQKLDKVTKNCNLLIQKQNATNYSMLLIQQEMQQLKQTSIILLEQVLTNRNVLMQSKINEQMQMIKRQMQMGMASNKNLYDQQMFTKINIQMQVLRKQIQQAKIENSNLGKTNIKSQQFYQAQTKRQFLQNQKIKKIKLQLEKFVVTKNNLFQKTIEEKMLILNNQMRQFMINNQDFKNKLQVNQQNQNIYYKNNSQLQQKQTNFPEFQIKYQYFPDKQKRNQQKKQEEIIEMPTDKQQNLLNIKQQFNQMMIIRNTQMQILIKKEIKTLKKQIQELKIVHSDMQELNIKDQLHKDTKIIQHIDQKYEQFENAIQLLQQSFNDRNILLQKTISQHTYMFNKQIQQLKILNNQNLHKIKESDMQNQEMQGKSSREIQFIVDQIKQLKIVIERLEQNKINDQSYLQAEIIDKQSYLQAEIIDKTFQDNLKYEKLKQQLDQHLEDIKKSMQTNIDQKMLILKKYIQTLQMVNANLQETIKNDQKIKITETQMKLTQETFNLEKIKKQLQNNLNSKVSQMQMQIKDNLEVFRKQICKFKVSNDQNTYLRKQIQRFKTSTQNMQKSINEPNQGQQSYKESLVSLKKELHKSLQYYNLSLQDRIDTKVKPLTLQINQLKKASKKCFMEQQVQKNTKLIQKIVEKIKQTKQNLANLELSVQNLYKSKQDPQVVKNEYKQVVKNEFKQQNNFLYQFGNQSIIEQKQAPKKKTSFYQEPSFQSSFSSSSSSPSLLPSSSYNPLTSKSKTGGTHHSNFQKRDANGRFCK